MANSSKRSLSKNLSQMKFMRRLNPSSDLEESEEAGALIEKWEAPNVLKISTESVTPTVTKCSFLECENLDRIGRFSFNKFNKEIERLAKQSPILASEKEEDDGTIPVEEVARRYEEITSRKFTGKRQRTELDLSNTDRHGFRKPTL